MKNELQAIATIFSLINPVMCMAMFQAAESGKTGTGRVGDATKAILTIAIILALAAFVGAPLLKMFGISLDAFSVAGGAVLSWIGFSMLAGHKTTTTPKQAEKAPEGGGRASLTPLVLFAASPGTITGVITIAAAHTGTKFPMTALIAIGTVLGITWILMILTKWLGGGKKGGPAQEMVGRYMGLIVLAMGIQFMLSGFKAFMGAG